MKQGFIIVLFMAFCSACLIQKQNGSSPPTDNYNKTKNVTFYTAYPYGNIMIPGEWTKTTNETDSRQFFRRNSDSTIISIGKNPRHKFSCYKKGMNDYQTVVAFYKWDSEYYETKGNAVDLIKRDEEKECVLWKATKGNKINTFLYGAKGGFIYSLMIEGNTLTANDDITFLTKLFRDN